jgi:hypothetical protein
VRPRGPGNEDGCQFDMDLARAPRRAPLTARKKGSGYENDHKAFRADYITRITARNFNAKRKHEG